MNCIDCGEVATHALERPCCASKDGLCALHARTRGNALRRLVRVHDGQPVRCDWCTTKTAELPTVVTL